MLRCASRKGDAKRFAKPTGVGGWVAEAESRCGYTVDLLVNGLYGTPDSSVNARRLLAVSFSCLARSEAERNRHNASPRISSASSVHGGGDWASETAFSG